MNHLLDEVAAVLRDADGVREGFAALKKRWPDADLALVRDEEPDGTTAYDILLREPEGTVSVAYSPALSMPWPERGATRYTDQDLARVDGRKLRVGEALTALDFLWYDHDVLARLVDTCLIHAELERDPVELTDTEVQAAADAYRRARGLLDPAATSRWLAERGLTEAAFTTLVADIAEVARLRQRIAGDRVPAWFAEHRAEFDTLVVAWSEEELPESAGEALEAVAAAVLRGRPAGVLRVPADQIPRDVHTVIVDREPAELTEHTRARAERALFDEWLARVRAAAPIEWFWLASDRTAGVR